jgi:Uma2 family endonuclease
MTLSTQLSTHQTLDEFLKMPETKPASEYIDGQIYQKPMPQGKHSIIQSQLVSAINQFSNPHKLALALTEIRCTFAGQSIVPDIAVFEWSRIPTDETGEIAHRFVTFPDWTIEILSPNQSSNRVINKIIFCLNQGTHLGWLIDPDDKSVIIFRPNQLPEVKHNNDMLPVIEVLVDWRISSDDIFSWLKVK